LLRQNFHFGTDGALRTITSVNATGTFDGDSMSGTATQEVRGPNDEIVQPAQTVNFTGARMHAASPAP
jgi:hypothetical protein